MVSSKDPFLSRSRGEIAIDRVILAEVLIVEIWEGVEEEAEDKIPYLGSGGGEFLCDVSVCSCSRAAPIRISLFCFFCFRLINCLIRISCAESPLGIRSD